MAYFRGRTRFVSALLAGFLAVWGVASYNRHGDSNEEARVKQAFESCKAGLIGNQADQAMACVPSNVDVYLDRLKSGIKNPAFVKNAKPSDSPGVDLLLRTALEKKVPDDLRPTLTFSILLQRIAEKKLLNPRDVQQIDLGPVSVNGDRASGEIYCQGTLTALRLPFIKEGGNWKIDILAILPYAEILMRLDRAIKSETEREQVDFLVSKLPSL